jgi:hypothetical protein
VEKIDRITPIVVVMSAAADLHETLLEENQEENSHAVFPDLVFEDKLLSENPEPSMRIANVAVVG